MLLASQGAKANATVALVHGGRAYPVGDVLDGARAYSIASMLDIIHHWQDVREDLESAYGRVESGGSGAGMPIREASLVAPIPQPIRDPICVAGNYRAHVAGAEAQTGLALSKRRSAFFFTKATETVVGPFDDIRYDPSVTSKVDYELELGVVIGRRGRDIREGDAMGYVFGFTILNDVSARDLQIVEPQPDFFRGKGLDTFMPMGPGIVPKEYIPDYTSLGMRLYVNGDLRQSATPAEMTRSVPALLEAVSRGRTLLPGDIIATGTPSGVALEMADPRWLTHGDVVRAEIDGLGVIENRVVDESRSS